MRKSPDLWFIPLDMPPPAMSACVRVLVLTPKSCSWHHKSRRGWPPTKRLWWVVKQTWAPFDFVDGATGYAGIANDYLQIVREKLGLEIEVITVPLGVNFYQWLAGKRLTFYGHFTIHMIGKSFSGFLSRTWRCLSLSLPVATTQPFLNLPICKTRPPLLLRGTP